MELVKYADGTEAAQDGLHLPGLTEQDAETLSCLIAGGILIWQSQKWNLTGT